MGFSVTALPSGGFDGDVPGFPLSRVSVYYVFKDEGKTVREFDEDATQERFARELELWAFAWSTPQAAAWARESWRWHSVAMWVRTAALCESSDAQAADKNSLHRFADQIGLTPAGLVGNGWAIAADEVAEKRQEKSADDEAAPKAPPKRRLRSVNGGG
ncbi:hypothetical protein [Arthrobacter alpinus]|nr:hypothetical protein [Arthrobacter alpinus]